MTLNDIRAAQSVNALKPAIKFLCDNMQAMTFGDFHAYKRTLESQAIKLGSSYSEINEIAENYQIYGEI